MASRKSASGMRGLSSIVEIEGIIIKDDFEPPRKNPPASKKTQHNQKSEIEKAFARQDKGIKDAFKLF
jgi:hypothetical protein